MRTWPVTRETSSGQIDDESLVVILNKQYLETISPATLNDYGYLSYDPGRDRFVIDGIRYEPAGDTYADHINNDGNLFYLILNRETRKTGDKVYA